LYYHPNSIALAPHIALVESGLEYNLEKIDHYGDKKTSEGRSFYELSPIGYVPAIRTREGFVLTESSAVLQFIADVAVDDALCPKIPSLDRYRVLQWVNFAATELHQKIMRLTPPGVTPEYREATLTQLKKRLDLLNTSLVDRNCLVGESFTIGDIFVFVAVRWWLNKVRIENYPALQCFMEAIGKRPAVLKAFREEGIE
jgi:glutathione S-transferase